MRYRVPCRRFPESNGRICAGRKSRGFLSSMSPPHRSGRSRPAERRANGPGPRRRPPHPGLGQSVPADEGLRLPGARGRLPDLFCHFSAVEASGRDMLPHGAVVTCQTVQGDRKPQVSKILAVEMPAAEPRPMSRGRPFDARHPDPYTVARPQVEMALPGTVKFYDPARGVRLRRSGRRQPQGVRPCQRVAALRPGGPDAGPARPGPNGKRAARAPGDGN